MLFKNNCTNLNNYILISKMYLHNFKITYERKFVYANVYMYVCIHKYMNRMSAWGSLGFMATTGEEEDERT